MAASSRNVDLLKTWAYNLEEQLLDTLSFGRQQLQVAQPKSCVGRLWYYPACRVLVAPSAKTGYCRSFPSCVRLQ